MYKLNLVEFESLDKKGGGVTSSSYDMENEY